VLCATCSCSILLPTLFLDTDAGSIASVRAACLARLDFDAHHITYQECATTSSDKLLEPHDSPNCLSPTMKPLSLDDLDRSLYTLAPRGLPAAFYEVEWDVIMVSTPLAVSTINAAGVAVHARWPEAAKMDCHTWF
jgi:hypothetical protein